MKEQYDINDGICNFGSTPAVRPTMLQAAKRGASSPTDYTHSATPSNFLRFRAT